MNKATFPANPIVGRRQRRGWRDLAYGSAPYQWLLGRRPPYQLLFTPPDLWPGDSARGYAVLAAGTIFTPDRAEPHDLPPGIEPHGFAWLRDLRANGTEAARRRGRELIRDWIVNFGRYDSVAWRPDLVAERIVQWLTQYDYFVRTADNGFRDLYFASIDRQAEHLFRVVRRTEPGAMRLAASKGLIYAGLCLPEGEVRYVRGIELFDGELQQRVFADGFVRERSPTRQADLLRHTLDVRATLAAAHRPMPVLVQNAIDRGAPALRTVLHPDGGLALFNGGDEIDAAAIARLLTLADEPGAAAAPFSGGFHRLNAGPTTLIADLAAPATESLSTGAHAGTLSFEMSVGRTRVIVNCGAFGGAHPRWREMSRTTAAHSTLTLADTNSSEILPTGPLGDGVRSVAAKRSDQGGDLWLEAEHDGYVQRFGLAHRRRLFLSSGGDDLRGEDALLRVNQGRRTAESFAVRFHLHPDISVDLEDGPRNRPAAAKLSLPDGSIWSFRAVGDALTALDASIYLGAPGAPRACRQLVLTGVPGPRDDAAVVKWAFKREL
ncbi:MAG: heparinase II/III family protein [Alphaproteobacteria bacterium]